MQFVIISIYIVLIIVVSIISSKRTNTLNDFFLAGRNLGGWMAAFAYGATYFSSVIFIGYAGRLGFTHGVSVSLIGIGNALLGSWLACTAHQEDHSPVKSLYYARLFSKEISK